MAIILVRKGQVEQVLIKGVVINDSASPSQAVPPTLDAGLSWLANRIKAITGESSWRTSAVATIKALWAKFAGATGHKHTGIDGDGQKIGLDGLSFDPATQAELDAHTSRTDNPHATTWNQTGAAPASHVGTGGVAHAVVVANGEAGFMTGADKAKLDGVAVGATNTPLSSSAPAALSMGATASAGTSTEAARADHAHPVSDTIPVATAAPTDTPAEGTVRLVNEAGVFKFYAYIGGGWRSSTLV